MKSGDCPDMPQSVAKAFEAFPADARMSLMDLRAMIFRVARAHAEIGPLTETLKWGEPAYLTEVTGSGSTIRLGCTKTEPANCAIFFNCRTNLIDTYRSLYPQDLTFQGNRAILLDISGDWPVKVLEHCIGLALTYHIRKRK